MKNKRKERGAPIWAWVLVGWMAAGTAAAFWHRGTLERSVGDRVELEQSHEIDWDLEQMSPREMRTLPGIGNKRALDIADAMWERPEEDGAFDMKTVPGIGEKTASTVASFLIEQKVANGPPGPVKRQPRILHGTVPGPIRGGVPLGAPRIPRRANQGPQ